jgi:hypothetical protein
VKQWLFQQEPVAALRATAKQLVGGGRPGRALEIDPDDTFIVSYPRSGNTWTRFLVANLLHRDGSTTFENIDARVPAIYKATSRELAGAPRPRILKSHEYFDPRYPRVIYIARDPRDVAVSYYYYRLKRRFMTDAVSIERFVTDFVAGRVGEFGTWYENVQSWLATRGGDEQRFLFTRYEDMKARPRDEVARMARFLGIPLAAAELDRVVDQSSFARMQELEKQTGAAWRPLKDSRSDIQFVRGGSVGGWRERLPRAASLAIESAWSDLMVKLGYACERPAAGAPRDESRVADLRARNGREQHP